MGGGLRGRRVKSLALLALEKHPTPLTRGRSSPATLSVVFLGASYLRRLETRDAGKNLNGSVKH